MNVRQMIEALEDYGDHLEVVVVVNRGETDKTFPLPEGSVEVGSPRGEPRVEIQVDW